MSATVSTALPWSPPERPAPAAAGAERLRLFLLLELAAHVARVELVDVEDAVEAQVVRVRAQEALDVRLRGQHFELLLFEGAQVLATNLRRLLDLREVEPLPQTSLAEAVADLEHGRSGVYDKR